MDRQWRQREVHARRQREAQEARNKIIQVSGFDEQLLMPMLLLHLILFEIL